MGGTSLASICTFRISDLKKCVDKTTSCSKPLYSSFERFCHTATSSTILVIFKLSLQGHAYRYGRSKISTCRGTSLASKCTFRISDFKHFVDKTTSGSKRLFSFYF